MRITWQRCNTYEDARDLCRGIYLHEWNGEPFYWGKAHNSFFGGGKRRIGDLFASGRYNVGYRHWIEGCLQHGARLYFGQLSALALASIDEVEKYLIHTYGQQMNRRVGPPSRQLELEHCGEIPASVTRNRLIERH
jgi:hypothetical protein